MVFFAVEDLFCSGAMVAGVLQRHIGCGGGAEVLQVKFFAAEEPSCYRVSYVPDELSGGGFSDAANEISCCGLCGCS